MSPTEHITTLTFDLFGTVLDLGSSLRRPIADFLRDCGSDVGVEQFWAQWRTTQRLEQYRDTIMMLGHSGYLETVQRAVRYVAASNHVKASKSDVERLMDAWWSLSPFPEVLPALRRLSQSYRLVVLSNGDPEFLAHLVERRVQFDFDDIFSVTTVGAFKPHPAVYRGAAMRLGVELEHCLMVSANSFDVIGARACGMRAAYVNRYRLPREDSPFEPDIETTDFTGLADILVRDEPN